MTLKRGDRRVLLLLAGLLLLSLLPRLFSSDGGPRWAVIYVDGTERHRLDVDGPLREIAIVTDDGHRSVIAVGEGGARFVDSDCPDRLCIDRGHLDKAGQSALCLPNRIEVRLEGAKNGEDDVDAHSQ